MYLQKNNDDEMFFNYKQKKGQFWYIDILIGLFVIIVVAILFVKGIVDIVDREKVVRDLLGEGVDISNSMMSKGLIDLSNPNNDWCVQSTGRIGFVEDAKINNAKFEKFKDLVRIPRGTCNNPSGGSIDGYRKSIILLGTNFDYVLYLQDKQGNIIGNPGGKVFGYDIGLSDPQNIGEIQNAIDGLPNAPENKVNIFRYAYYDTDPVDGKGELIRIGITIWKPEQ